jgi:D-alanine-D-alanine ligase
MNKDVSTKLFARGGIPTSPWRTVARDDWARNRAEAMRGLAKLLGEGPLFIKPVDQGSAIGVSRVDRASQLEEAMGACFKISGGALAELFVEGRELTVGILGADALPVIEIIPRRGFYDFHAKYAPGGSRHIVPAELSERTHLSVQRVALRAFNALHCSVYGRVDAILRADGRVSVLEVNTIPGMTATSLLPESARAAGLDFDRLVLAIVRHSLDSRRKSRAK